MSDRRQEREEREPGDICPPCLGNGYFLTEQGWTAPCVLCPDCDGSGTFSAAVARILSGERETDQ